MDAPDLRSWLDVLDAARELTRVRALVDWEPLRRLNELLTWHIERVDVAVPDLLFDCLNFRAH